LFTYCTSYKEGFSPQFVDDDSTDPYAVLDMEGDIWLEGFSFDPVDNFGDCCDGAGGTLSCEDLYRSEIGEPCGVDSDCNGESIICDGGKCQEQVVFTEAFTPTPTSISTLSPTLSPTALDTIQDDGSNGYTLFDESIEDPCSVDSDCGMGFICGAGLCLATTPTEADVVMEDNDILSPPHEETSTAEIDDNRLNLVASEANGDDLQQKATTKPTEERTDEGATMSSSSSSLSTTILAFHFLPFICSWTTVAYTLFGF
jgi:hypothetical protein